MILSDLSPLRSSKKTRKSDLKVELILKSSFFVVVRMNKESSYEKNYETFMNLCHTWKLYCSPLKILISRRFPKQAATSL
jgi:hypothetical protein